MLLSAFSLFGCACIGVYSIATDQMVIIPQQVRKEKVKELQDCLRAKVLCTSIGESVLVGALACANSNGIILPHIVREEEVKTIQANSEINVAIMKTRNTAYGNLVLANDYGALVDPRLEGKDVKRIEDTLAVETIPGEIAGSMYVGSSATATNKGVLAHPLTTDEEKKLLLDVLKVHVDVGTVNRGIPYVSTGLIANRYGAMTGFVTTGPELFIIGQALDVV